MQSSDDPQFSIVREYQVWGTENGEERSCTFDTFDEAERVRRDGHPHAPTWKPNRRKRVKFAIVLYRTVAFPCSEEVRHYPVTKFARIADCDMIHENDEALRRLTVTPPRPRTVHADQHGVLLCSPNALGVEA